MEFEMSEHNDNAMLEEQAEVASLMASRASAVTAGITVGSHQSDLTLVDPETGVKRIANINDRHDMDLLAMQRGETGYRETKWNPEDPNAASYNVLYGRGTLLPQDTIADLGFTGNLPGIWPPNLSVMMDFFLVNEPTMKADGMHSLIFIYLTTTSELMLQIRGHKQLHSCTSLEAYACLHGYMMLYCSGLGIPDNDDLDLLAEKQEIAGKDRFELLLHTARAVQLTLPQLEVLACGMFRHKTAMTNATNDEEKEAATEKYHDSYASVTKHVFESFLWYGRSDGFEFSEEQMRQCNFYDLSVLADSELGKQAAARGELSAIQPPAEAETPIVNIRIRSRETPAWFIKAWVSACRAFGLPTMRLPAELPVWIDESVLVSVLSRMVLYHYHTKRSEICSDLYARVLAPFYNMATNGGPQVLTANVCLELAKEFYLVTQTTLKLMEECIVRLLAPVFDFDQLYASKIASEYEIILEKKKGMEVVEFFKEGEQNIMRSDKWHLHFAPTHHSETEQRIATESSLELCRAEDCLGPLMDGIVAHLQNDDLFRTRRWIPSALYTVAFALSAHVCNHAVVTKNAVGKQLIEKFSKKATEKFAKTLPMRSYIAGYIKNKKAEVDAANSGMTEDVDTSSKRKPEEELHPENGDDEEDSETFSRNPSSPLSESSDEPEEGSSTMVE